MKIAIISDIHDNRINLLKCLNWCQENAVESIICCGDLTNDESLELLSKSFAGKIYLVEGNAEIYDADNLKKYGNIKLFGKRGRVEINGKKICFCHEPSLISDFFEKEKCDIIFYGHTHKPWEENKKGARVINPGTLGGVFTRSTFAFWDTGTEDIKLKLLEWL